MRHPPYHEIINIKEECKEYARLCNGKSNKFILYTEWEDHIKGLLSDFRSPTDLYNFKRYCINADRTQEKAPDMYFAYIGMLIPIYVDIIWKDMPAFLAIISFTGILAYAMVQNKKLAKESCFFKDVVEIIEEVECDQNMVGDELRAC